MEFEWDEAKARTNRSKHGINFSAAIEIFDDSDCLVRPDPRPHGEERYRALGLVEGRVLQVVFTMREGVCRIISARRASRRERTNYSVQARN